MVEYDCTSNSIKQIVPYPEEVKVRGPVTCKYKEDTIVIVDGGHKTVDPPYTGYGHRNACLLTFNICSNSFSKPVGIPRIGGGCCVVVLKEYIHIFHGACNADCEYLVYSVNDGTYDRYRDQPECHAYSCVVVTRGPGPQFCKFGGHGVGWKFGRNHVQRTFCTGRLNNGDPAAPIVWTCRNHNFQIPGRKYQCGFVHYGHVVIIFGVQDEETKKCNIMSILDLRDDSGWKPISITYPSADSYVATMDHAGNVHLFGSYRVHEGTKSNHLCIAVKTLMSEVDIVNMEQDDVTDNDCMFLSSKI